MSQPDDHDPRHLGQGDLGQGDPSQDNRGQGDPGQDNLRLEQQLERAWDASARGRPGRARAPADVIGAALTTFRVQRRRRFVGASTLCVALLAVGWWAVTPPASEGPDVETADAVAYGNDLYRRVMHERVPFDDDDPDYLVRDAEARAEYLAALEHPSSHVRRIALAMLTYAGIEAPVDTLTHLLLEHREDLERPLQVASVGDAGRLVAEAIELRRLATLRSVLNATSVQAARGHPVIAWKALVPFLEHDDHTVRLITVTALGHVEGYVPGASVRRLMREDPELPIRTAAAALLQTRLGAQGDQEVLAHLTTLDDPPAEKILLRGLMEVPGFLAVARAKFAQRPDDLDLRMAYARALFRTGDPEPARQALPRVLREGTGNAVSTAAFLIREMDEVGLRRELIQQRARLSPAIRRSLATAVVLWDFQSGDPQRILESVSLLGADGRRSDVRLLAPHREHRDPTVRAAVAAAMARMGSR